MSRYWPEVPFGFSISLSSLRTKGLRIVWLHNPAKYSRSLLLPMFKYKLKAKEKSENACSIMQQSRFYILVGQYFTFTCDQVMFCDLVVCQKCPRPEVYHQENQLDGKALCPASWCRINCVEQTLNTFATTVASN